MSVQTTLNEPDQRLLSLIAAVENDLPEQLGTTELAQYGETVDRIRELAQEAKHARLTRRAHDLVALLSRDADFPSDMSDLTTRDPSFLVPLAVAGRDGRPVSGPALGVWAGAQRPALAPGPWSLAERELKDLVGQQAKPVVPSPASGSLTVPYLPLSKANPLTAVTRTDLPAVVVKPVPAEIRAAVDDATKELEAYTRTLESFEELSFAIRAARLPRGLFDRWMQQPEGARLAHVARELRRSERVQLQGLIKALLPDVQAPDRRHIVALSEFLGRLCIGVEPDPRFLAPLGNPETQLRLFDWRHADDEPSKQFVNAVGVLHVGLAMAGADGEVDPVEIAHIRDTALELLVDDDERVRLGLRAEALASAPPEFDRLLLRLKGLRPAAKEVIADLLVGVASTDGHVSDVEYEALQQAYRAMRLGIPALDRKLEELRGDVLLTDAVGATSDRRSQLGRELDAKRFDALSELLLGAPPSAS